MQLEVTLIALFVSTYLTLAAMYYKLAKIESQVNMIFKNVEISMKFRRKTRKLRA